MTGHPPFLLSSGPKQPSVGEDLLSTQVHLLHLTLGDL